MDSYPSPSRHPDLIGVQGGRANSFVLTPVGGAEYYVYILASGRNGTLYVGVTNDLARRINEHRTGTADSFTGRHGVTKLVWFKVTPDSPPPENVASLELKLIEAANPTWRDLYDELSLCTRVLPTLGPSIKSG